MYKIGPIAWIPLVLISFAACVPEDEGPNGGTDLGHPFSIDKVFSEGSTIYGFGHYLVEPGAGAGRPGGNMLLALDAESLILNDQPIQGPDTEFPNRTVWDIAEMEVVGLGSESLIGIDQSAEESPLELSFYDLSRPLFPEKKQSETLPGTENYQLMNATQLNESKVLLSLADLEAETSQTLLLSTNVLNEERVLAKLNGSSCYPSLLEGQYLYCIEQPYFGFGDLWQDEGKLVVYEWDADSQSLLEKGETFVELQGTVAFDMVYLAQESELLVPNQEKESFQVFDLKDPADPQFKAEASLDGGVASVVMEAVDSSRFLMSNGSDISLVQADDGAAELSTLASWNRVVRSIDSYQGEQGEDGFYVWARGQHGVWLVEVQDEQMQNWGGMFRRYSDQAFDQGRIVEEKW